MNNDLTSLIINTLKERQLQDGGFQSGSDNNCRPDATAWAIIALQSAGVESQALPSARNRLMQDQLTDGRISISSQHPEAYWPTAVAVLAWQCAPEFQASQHRAISFLLNAVGYHYPKQPDAPCDHDTSIRGWPWIGDTHSWVIPTALAAIALKAAGYAKHERIREATALLLDRQLPRGGWNFGNTRVFGLELHPMVESTGVALNALAGSVSPQGINASLTYLSKSLARQKTPLSLCWGLLGLRSWGLKLPEGESWLAACWRGQERFGAYDTVALSLMLLALTLPEGIPSLFSSPT
jgi:hypothetical protein